MTRARPSAHTQPEYLRALEKGTAREGARATVPRSAAWRRIARAVSFASEALAETTDAAASRAEPCARPGASMTHETSIEPEVMVPVLSRQSTSTRASISMQ